MPTTATPARTGNPWQARLSGLIASLTLLVLLLGIPAALSFIAGNPIPSSVPSLSQAKDAVLSPDDGHLFLTALILIAWISWATFAVSVLLEAAAGIRGLPAPHLPGLGWQQRGAAGLLAMAALLLTAGQAGAATLPHTGLPGPAPAPAAVTAPQADTAPAPAVQAQQNAPTAPAAGATVDYHVQPGDTPWGIAQTQLGDGARYPQILNPNYGVPQPDGGHLDTSHWLQPGWVLKIPAPPTTQAAPDTGAVTVHEGDTLSGLSQARYGDASHAPQIAAANEGRPQPDGHSLSDPNHIEPGWTLTLPPLTGATPPVAPAPDAHQAPDPAVAAQQRAEQAQQLQKAAQDAARQQAQTEQAQREAAAAAAAQHPTPTPEQTQTQSPAPATPAPEPSQHYTAVSPTDTGSNSAVRTELGVGAILAAGVLGLLAQRRRNQQRRRAPGATIPMPTGPAADTEHDLRATAAPLDIATVDLALRTLAHHCHRTDQPLPYVRAARLTRNQFELYLGEPAGLPAPWTATTDTTVWTLTTDLDEAHIITDEEAAEVNAPYPGLVTIGHDLEDAHIFLDLEEAGALALVGEPTATRDILTALALELATSRWADDLQVTIVGACHDLETSMQTGRIRYLPDVGQILTDLTHRANADRDILADVDSPDLQHARAEGAAPGIWTPEIVLIAGEITDSQRTTLAGVLESLPRVAVAAVTSGEPVGEWSLTLGEDNTAVLAPIGLTLRPQRVDEATYAHLTEVMATANTTTPAATSAGEAQVADLPEPTADTVPVQDDDETPAATATASTPTDLDTSPEPVAEDATTVVDEPSIASPTDTAETSTAAPGEPDISDHHHDTVDEDTDTAHDDSSGPTPDAAPTPQAAETGTHAQVRQLHPPAPRILILGPVDVEGAHGQIKPNDQGRAIELAALIALHPGGDHIAIDAAMAPGKTVSTNTRNAQMSRLRRWLGTAPDGQDYLLRHTAAHGYRWHPAVYTDWQQFEDLLPDGAQKAATDRLEQALTLIRGRPFQDVKDRYYAWAEENVQIMVSAIVDAAYELGHRRLLENRWQDATHAATRGLTVEPGMERLWRIRILAAHASGNTTATTTAVDRLLAITDELGGDLEDATEQLLTDLADNTAPRRKQLAAYAL